jgi:hypothetical protein
MYSNFSPSAIAPPKLVLIGKQVGLLNADTGGLTAVYGVIVRQDCANNLRLLAHEFVHVAQYERLGREGFLQEYIRQIAEPEYPDAFRIRGGSEGC